MWDKRTTEEGGRKLRKKKVFKEQKGSDKESAQLVKIASHWESEKLHARFICNLYNLIKSKSKWYLTNLLEY